MQALRAHSPICKNHCRKLFRAYLRGYRVGAYRVHYCVLPHAQQPAGQPLLAGSAVTNLNQPAKPAIRSVLIALMLAIFLGALDQTIVAVSMPAISAQFKDVSLLAWVISGYMVAMTVAVPIYGKLGDLYGRRRLMLFGMGLFTLASGLCAMAQSMEQLVLAG